MIVPCSSARKALTSALSWEAGPEQGRRAVFVSWWHLARSQTYDERKGKEFAIQIGQTIASGQAGRSIMPASQVGKQAQQG